MKKISAFILLFRIPILEMILIVKFEIPGNDGNLNSFTDPKSRLVVK